MSLYADYIKERTDDSIIESPFGFATYRYLNDGKSVYIIDIYTVPKERRAGRASEFADLIAKEAKAKGAVEMLGTVVPSAKNSHASLRVLLAYGMTLESAGPNMIVMRKDL